MSAIQKQAWFHLAVIGVTVVAVAVALPWLGPGAQGFLGLLGVLPLGMMFLRRRGGDVVTDERDAAIHQQAARIGFAVVWVVLIAGAMSAWGVYGDGGAVPVPVVMLAVWVAFMVLIAATAIATLVLNARG